MRPVAIIANPDSGKDIRRLVAHGSVFHSGEKVNLIRRILLGMDSVGVEQVLIMPDHYHLGERALDGLDISMEIAFLDMIPENTQDDSTRAAEISVSMDAACIVVLGGDGTCRAVAKAGSEIPLLPIATGTNNVFSTMVEGTLAGIAAGVFAMNESQSDAFISKQPRLEIYRGSNLIDIALIDIVVTNEDFVGSRALWDVSSLKEVFLTRAEPENIGFSSLGGYLCHLPPNSGQGLYLRIGPGGKRVRAPIAPGLVKTVPIESYRIFNPGEDIAIEYTPAVIALDGERELSIAEGDELTIKLNLDGPPIIKMAEILRRASDACLFLIDEA